MIPVLRPLCNLNKNIRSHCYGKFLKSGTVLLLLVFLTGLGGCVSGRSQPPDGYRYEYGRSDLHQNAQGEWVHTDIPVVVPVWKTRPGPETGPYRHEPLNENYSGYQAKDVVRLYKEMGMTPGANQWPAGSYISEEEYSRKYPSSKKKKIRKSSNKPDADADGFQQGGWTDSSYGN